MTDSPDNAQEACRTRLAALLAGQRVGVLASGGQGQPYCNLIAFVASGDFCRVAFITPRATRKFANLQADPRASILIDDRVKLSAGFAAVAAATAIGDVAEPDERTRAELLEQYLRRHPALEGFARSADSALLVLDVARWIVVDEFQNVIELQP